MSFTHAVSRADLAGGKPVAVTIGDVDVVVVEAEGQVFALLDECSHGNIPLSEGEVSGCSIECWLHGSRFDLATGAALNLPATEPVATYPVQIDGDEILVDVEHPSHQEN